MKYNADVLEVSVAGEIQVTYKAPVKISEMPKLIAASEAYQFLLPLFGNDIGYREHFIILLLNRMCRVLGYSRISIGGMAGTVCDPKIIFQVALGSNASSIILAHNHPSGECKPSSNDIALTKKLVSAGQFLELPVHDHIICGQDTFYSFSQEGMM